MRFPGHREATHYFPVERKVRRGGSLPGGESPGWYLLGLDHVLADMEVEVPAQLVEELGLHSGESTPMEDEGLDRLLQRLEQRGLRPSITAGGTVSNSLNNYTFLAGEAAVLLGAIPRRLEFGDAAFLYVAHTPRAVDLSHLVAVEGNIGRALTLVEPGGERTFAVAAGVSEEFPPEMVDPVLVEHASAVLVTLYCLRHRQAPIAAATKRLLRLACEFRVPVALGMGTGSLVRQLSGELPQLLRSWVDIAAMNQFEARALTGQEDSLLACQQILDWVDLVIITEGARGMTMGGWVDEAHLRQTDQAIRSKSIAEYNRYEYSRVMKRSDCRNPVKIYTHIHPYRGGPDRLASTSGAGDAALAAVLHDVAANRFHRHAVPGSGKHPRGVPFLSYSSLSRCAQYGNRVAYEILSSRSPRLDRPVGPDRLGDEDDTASVS